MNDRRISVVGGLVFALHLIGLACALTVSIDADHLLAVVQNCGAPITIWKLLTCWGGRPLHLPAVLISGGLWGISCALFAGLLLVALVMARRDREHGVIGR
jgi:hypothetical protein